MPPKRDASKASKATKADDKPAATGRATRAAKKRDQVDLAAEEPVVETKKTKVADKEEKVPSKSKDTNKRKKEPTEASEQEAKPATKRKRTVAAKPSPSKDVNDNVEQIEPDDKTKRGRKKATAPVEETVDLKEAPVVAEQQAAKRGRARGKKAAEPEVEEQPAATTRRGRKKETAEISSQPEEVKEPIKRGQGRAKKAASDEPEEIATQEEKPSEKQATEPAKRVRGRAKKAASDEPEEIATQEEKPSEKPAKKARGRTASTRKAAEEVEPPKEVEPVADEQPAKKRGAKKKEQEAPASEEPASQEPAATARSARGRSRTQRTQAEQEAEQPPAKSKARTRKASESKDEPPVEQQVEPEAEPEKPKRGKRAASSKAESSTRDETEKSAVVRGRRAASGAKKPAEEADDQIVDEQPAKRGKTKSKPSDEAEQPAEPVSRKGRGKAKAEEVVPADTQAGKRAKKKVVEAEASADEAEPAASSDEKVSKPSDLSVITERPNEIVDEEDEDDNKSEKELVIDLKEDLPPPPKKRGRKAKIVTEVPAAETVKSQQSEPVASDSQSTAEPVAKRGRAKKPPKTAKQTGEEQSELPARQSKRKALVSEDDKASPNEDADEHLEQPPAESLPTQPTDDKEEPAVELPSEHEADEKESEMQVDLEPVAEEPHSAKRPVEEASEEHEEGEEKTLEPEQEKAQAEERQEEKLEDEEQQGEEKQEEKLEEIADESANSQFDVDKLKSDVHTVLDDIKSLVEISTRDLNSVDSTIDDTSSTSLNETGEVISAKELEEYTSDDDGLKITYNSIINVNETKVTSELPSTSTTPSFTICSESEANARKRIKLFKTEAELPLPPLEGKLISFGNDMFGELGRNECGTERHRPGQLPINQSESFCFICSQSQHSACISTAGRLYTFGNNDECALGRPTSKDDDTQAATPTMLDSTLSLYRFCKATVGESHTAVLTTTGSVFYWGNFRDQNGQAGLTADILQPTIQPVAVELSHDIVSIASGANFLLLLDSYGTVYSLGIGERGELGRFPDEASCKFDAKTFNREQRARYLEPQPIQFPKNAKIDAIWGGEYSAFARAADNGRLFAWGLNNYNQLGITKREGDALCVYEPCEISYFSKSGLRIEKVVGGPHHSLMLDDQGRVYSCGRREYGRLGLGEIQKDPVQPTLIKHLESEIVDIACGLTVSYAVSARGELYSWGAGESMLGLGEKTNEQDHLEPTLVRSNLMSRFRCERVTAGSAHCLVLGQLTDDVNNNRRNGASGLVI